MILRRGHMNQLMSDTIDYATDGNKNPLTCSQPLGAGNSIRLGGAIRVAGIASTIIAQYFYGRVTTNRIAPTGEVVIIV
jgi:hypothetical protein